MALLKIALGWLCAAMFLPGWGQTAAGDANEIRTRQTAIASAEVVRSDSSTISLPNGAKAAPAILKLCDPERDADDRDAEQTAHDQVAECEPPASEDNPEDVADHTESLVPCPRAGMSIRPNGQSAYPASLND